MSQKKIELTGITRNLPDSTVPDGSTQEIINLRPKDGAWRPVGPKTSDISVPTDVRFIHIINDNLKIVIGSTGGDTNTLKYWVYKNNVGSNPVTATTAMSANTVFCQLHNSLLVSDPVSGLTTTLLYNPDTDLYTEYSDLVPEMPLPLMQVIANATDNENVTSSFYNGNTNDAWDIARTGEILKLMNENQIINATRKNGYLIGAYLVRCAWELWDGTIVRHTLPSFVEVSTVKQMYRCSNLIPSGWGVQYRTDFEAKNLQFKLSCTSNWLNDIKAKYKDIVRSLNIYISPTKFPELLPSVYLEANQDHNAGAFPEPYIADDYGTPDIKGMNYFLLQQINLEDITTNWLTLTPGSLASLTTAAPMPVDNFTHHKLYGNRLFVYNERIFMGDVKNTLYKGFAPSGYISDAGTAGPSYSVGFEFDILTPQGVKTVFSGWTACTTWTNENFLHPQFQMAGSNPNYWGYPDARAKKARMLIISGSVIYKADELPLVSIPELNFAYHTGFLAVVMNLTTACPIVALKTGLDSYWDANRVQASEYQNPFNWPAINSYRMQGKVLGMSTNTVALSQGQFGQFPIYCFTSEGIWTMNIGDGEILISTITPLSREVCNNPGSITQIDGGTVFSTSKGLYILQGNQTLEISQPAEGNHLSRISGTLNYEAIANNPNLYQVKAFLCSSTILTYITGARVAWDHIHKEIIISNPLYSYSWVYNMEYKRWFKIGQVFTNFVQDFPITYGYHTISAVYSKYDMSEEDYSELVAVHMETRPMKLNPAAYKKINRAVIDGWINNNLEYPFSVNLFGSPDKRNWYLLNASNTFGARNQLIIGRSTFSCYYYILAIGGKVDEEAYFIGFDVDFEETFKDKLR